MFSHRHICIYDVYLKINMNVVIKVNPQGPYTFWEGDDSLTIPPSTRRLSCRPCCFVTLIWASSSLDTCLHHWSHYVHINYTSTSLDTCLHHWSHYVHINYYNYLLLFGGIIFFSSPWKHKSTLHRFYILNKWEYDVMHNQGFMCMMYQNYKGFIRSGQGVNRLLKLIQHSADERLM